MFKKILPHSIIVLCVVLLVFLIIDQVNSAMGFVNNQGTKIIMMLQCAASLILAVWFAVQEHRRK